MADKMRHETKSYRNGDWIIYRCEQCAYEYRENWRTGDQVVNNSQSNIQHFGGYYSKEYKEAFESVN